MYGGVENRFFNLNQEGRERNETLRGVIHEFSHQYWGGIITPNYIGGYAMLTEVLAKYSELVLREQFYGKYSNSQRLEQALDIYLRNRTRSPETEKPLTKIGFDPIVAYQKGLHSMTALHALIGEEKVNKALRNLILKYRHPVRPTSLHLLNEYYEVSDSSDHAIITDLFARVVFHEFKLNSVNVEKTGNTFKTELDITSIKYVLNEETNTEFTETINDSIEIAFYSGYPDSENKNMTFITKVKLTSEQSSISIESNHKPKFIKIDPNRYRLDRSIEDNIIEVN